MKQAMKGKGLKRLGVFGIPAIAVLIVCVMLFSNILGGNVVHAGGDLMKDVTRGKVEAVNLSDGFIKSSADFSIDLLKKSVETGKNSLVSPTSVYFALAMTGNGADGRTLEEFESVLGKYKLKMGDINKFSYSYANSLTGTKTAKFNIANSIWYRDDESLTVNKDFLKVNADYYGAAAYKADFNSSRTVGDINNWVKSNTNNLIDKIVDRIDKDKVMYLINTLYFEDEWQKQYSKNNVRKGDFKPDSGAAISTDFMYSSESIYLKDDMAQGFIKPYKDNKYSFAALLPDQGVRVEDYVSKLTGEKFVSLIKNKTNATVNAGLPKFKSSYTKSLVDSLRAMGLKECFNGGLANFSVSV